jgi:Na+/phosphate symporter
VAGLRAVVSRLDSEDAALEGVVEDGIDERARALELSHFERVSRGVAEAVETDAIFTDLVHVLRQMHYHVAAMARILRAGGTRR